VKLGPPPEDDQTTRDIAELAPAEITEEITMGDHGGDGLRERAEITMSAAGGADER
jgi:hypothetical protein